MSIQDKSMIIPPVYGHENHTAYNQFKVMSSNEQRNNSGNSSNQLPLLKNKAGRYIKHKKSTQNALFFMLHMKAIGLFWVLVLSYIKSTIIMETEEKLAK